MQEEVLQSIPKQSLMQVDLLQSIPRKVGHHASLLLRLPSAKECGRLAMDRSDSTLDVCCHLGIATEHAIYACSFATALCRLCYRASYKMREACEQIFPSSLFGKTDMRLRLRLLCVSERHCYRAWLQFCSNLSIRHAPRGRSMKMRMIMIMIMLHFPSVLT